MRFDLEALNYEFQAHGEARLPAPLYLPKEARALLPFAKLCHDAADDVAAPCAICDEQRGV